MSGHNRVQLWGYLGGDPDLRFTQSGKGVLSLRLATTEVYFDSDRNKKEVTEWHNVVFWGKRAEGLAKFLRKGMAVFVEGKLRTRSWEGKDGVKRYVTEVHCLSCCVHGKGGGGRPLPDESTPEAQGARPVDDFGGPPPPQDNGPDFPDDDDIPF